MSDRHDTRQSVSAGIRVRVLQPGMPPLPRCCAIHADWPTLAEHLLRDFPTATISQVVQQLRRARTEVDRAGLEGSDALLVAELVIRRRLIDPSAGETSPVIDLIDRDDN